MRRLLLTALVLGGVATGLIVAGNYEIGPVVITREGTQKVIQSFGEPRIVIEPGLSLRIPGVEEVKTYDRRLLYLNIKSDMVQTKDQERIVVDNYVMWRIENPKQFFSSFPKGMNQAEMQIDRVARANVREIIGQHTLTDVLTDQRIAIMRKIVEGTTESFEGTGIAIQDVRINRTELPPTIEKNVYARMKTDRERMARKYRAEGEEQSRRVRAKADRNARVMVAEARSQAEVIRGEGDAEAARIYAEAHQADPEFYAFVRSLAAYRKTIGEDTTLVMSPNSEFFKFLDMRSSSDESTDSAP